MKNEKLIQEEDCKECNGKGFIRQDVTFWDSTVTEEFDCYECEGTGSVQVHSEDDDENVVQYSQQSVEYVFNQIFGVK